MQMESASGAGAVFGVEGLVYAGQIVEGSSDALLVSNASYLLQVSFLFAGLGGTES